MCTFELFPVVICIPVDRKRVVAVSELVDLSFSGDTTPTFGVSIATDPDITRCTAARCVAVKQTTGVSHAAI